MLFPMYTVRAEVFLRMTVVEPHEELKAGTRLDKPRLCCRSIVYIGSTELSIVRREGL